MKLFESTKKLIEKTKNREKVPSLKVVEVILVQRNLVDNQYHQKPEVLYTFTPNKSMHEKPYFLFPNVFKKMAFPKKMHWNMIFLVSSGKMIFLFPENMILFFRRKMKDDLSQKKYMEI